MRKPRFSIAGLMAIVLVAAVGLAALRSPSPAWASTLFMVTCGVFGLAIVGAIYRSGVARAWWLGFCVFGMGYMAVTGFTRSGYLYPQMPTSHLLIALRPVLGHPVELVTGPRSPNALRALYVYMQIGHALWALLAALLGGTLARIFLGRPADRPVGPEPGASPMDQRPRRRWLRPVLIAWSAAVLATAAAAIRSGPDAGTWAGATFFLSCGLLGLSCLVAIFNRGRRRQAAVGAALFGIGYVFLAFGRAPYQLLPPGQIRTVHSVYQPLPTSSLLDGLRRWAPALAGGHAAADARILEAMERPVAMTFPESTPLKDVLRYVTTATATPTYPGIPIYIDLIGLQEAEMTPSSNVSIDLVGVPLKTTLRACLEQLGLDYRVQDGYLRVTKAADPGELDSLDLIAYSQRWNQPEPVGLSSDTDDPFLIVGHCLLALLAAGSGAVLAPLVAEPGVQSKPQSERR
jgi:hypothetical protein